MNNAQQNAATFALAAIYENGNDATEGLTLSGFTSIWRQLIVRQYTWLRGTLGIEVTFQAGQPFEGPGAAIKMLDYIERTHHLPVSTDFNESELNGERGNLLFRAAHDLSHYLCDLERRERGIRCNFSLDGETHAAHKQTEMLLAMSSGLTRAQKVALVATVFSEVVLQAAVYYARGDFAAQKVVLAPLDAINAWYTANGLAPFEF